ncbi:unnamed protein product [Rotaria sp. Silwood2]|nr:unnamed protein product [Rotaria sp. Silwood2]CAF4631621.1 unnamed protein product [Rotaria sp. Silwood2]
MEAFQKLTNLAVTNTNLANLKLQNLKELTSLVISLNLAMSSIQIGTMPRLYSLDINGNSVLKTLTIENLDLLQSLSINSNQELTSITAKNVTTLRFLSIYNADQLKAANFTNLTDVTSVTLSQHPALESISLADLPRLTAVYINENPHLQTLLFTNTPQVNQIDLSNCQLTSFPISILTLTSLTTLKMPFNQLSSLPTTISTDLPKLTVLDLSNNRFQGNIIQPPLIYVSELYLANNLLTTLNGIREYKSLQKLVLDYNRITVIPLEIMKISPILQYLWITSNPLSTIPYTMTNMRSLKSIFAMNNTLSYDEKAYLIKLFQVTSITINLF